MVTSSSGQKTWVHTFFRLRIIFCRKFEITVLAATKSHLQCSNLEMSFRVATKLPRLYQSFPTKLFRVNFGRPDVVLRPWKFASALFDIKADHEGYVYPKIDQVEAGNYIGRLNSCFLSSLSSLSNTDILLTPAPQAQMALS